MVDTVFRRFKDFDPYKGTPIDIMHNMESGIMKDLLEVPRTAPKSTCHFMEFGLQVLEEYMTSRALQLSMALNADGRSETRPHAASVMVTAWKYKVNQRLSRWAPWTGRRCAHIS